MCFRTEKNINLKVPKIIFLFGTLKLKVGGSNRPLQRLLDAFKFEAIMLGLTDSPLPVQGILIIVTLEYQR